MLLLSDPPEEKEGEPGLLTLGRSLMLGVAPPNWAQLRLGVNLRAAELVRKSGLCLVWVPEGDIVEALVAAADKQTRDRVLLDATGGILASVEARTEEVDHSLLAEQKAAVLEAIEVNRSGYAGASQTLCATIVSSLLERHYGFDFTQARRAFTEESRKSQGFWSLRRALVQESLRHSIVVSTQRSAEAGFNRHLSCHGADLSHLTEPHALEALMLAGGALRELNEVYRVAEFGFGPSPQLAQYASEHSTKLLARTEAAVASPIG